MFYIDLNWVLIYFRTLTSRTVLLSFVIDCHLCWSSTCKREENIINLRKGQVILCFQFEKLMCEGCSFLVMNAFGQSLEVTDKEP